MNADNVKPYGKLVHEVAKAGGIDKFCDAIEQNGYFKGANDKQDELIPYLVVMGIVAVAEGAVIGYRFIKDKINQRSIKKVSLDNEAQQARETLTDLFENNIEEGESDEEQEIVDKYKADQNDIS